VTPDSELIARVIAFDDHAAFATLVRRYQSNVRGFLRHLTSDHALADDLAQETFVCAYRQLRRFHGRSAFSTWLIGIAYNGWRNALRRRQRAAKSVENVQTAVESVVPSLDWQHDLAVALNHLSSDERRALHACYQQGLTHDEAAVFLNWPLGTVKTHLARGKEKLRQFLAVWNPQN
jgi:RNA polymerase sigma factor (sigma-70 family)